MSHERFMRTALALARRGLGHTSPNPAVGAVVVRNGRIVSRGYHRKAGLPHAEVLALEGAGKGSKGADLYVTLEPCNHHGRTPPCTEAVIAAGIKRVFIGAVDPNPEVAGKGMERLRRAGVEVTSGILAERCRRLNEAYEKYITTGLPFVTLKLASTLDGRIATKTGESVWITSEDSRRRVHRMRSLVDCVIVGSGTALKDDPELTVRLVRGRNPLRALIDSDLKVPPDSRLFHPSGAGCFVFTRRGVDREKARLREERGAEVIPVRRTRNGLSLKGVLRELGKREITSVMVEGGSALAAGFLSEGLVDKVVWFAAPALLGGDALSAVGELNIRRISGALRLKDVTTSRVGVDILVEGYL